MKLDVRVRMVNQNLIYGGYFHSQLNTSGLDFIYMGQVKTSFALIWAYRAELRSRPFDESWSDHVTAGRLFLERHFS